MRMPSTCSRPFPKAVASHAPFVKIIDLQWHWSLAATWCAEIAAARSVNVLFAVSPFTHPLDASSWIERTLKKRSAPMSRGHDTAWCWAWHLGRPALALVKPSVHGRRVEWCRFINDDHDALHVFPPSFGSEISLI